MKRAVEVLDHDLVYVGDLWQWVKLTVVIVVLFALASGCVTMAKIGVVDSEKDKYNYWTRYYETRMGLPPTKIVFEADPLDKRCAWVDAEVEITDKGVVPTQSVVHYDMWRKGCPKPWQLAKHEMCHLRWMHPYFRHSADQEIDTALKEAEAECCEAEYYTRGAR